MADRQVKVTYSLPANLVEGVRSAVREGAAPSYSAFIERALAEELRRTRERALEEAFKLAAEDPGLAADIAAVQEEFAGADAELAGGGE
jgi:Arc/MetJ-type ribon-helix-helix transcriptional regulator